MKWMAEKGLRVLGRGYNVIPIVPGEKAPAIKNFLTIKTSVDDVRRWNSNGFAGHGIGVVCGYTILVDLDIPNAAVNKLQRWIEMNIGFGLVRVGQPPKLGIVFRSEQPMPTKLSRVYFDLTGRRCRIEVLGVGRQFVAYAIHPDTGRPYVWLGRSLEDTAAGDNLVITDRDVVALFGEFDRVAAEEGWRSAATAPAADGPGGRKLGPVGLTDDEIREILMAVPNDIEPREDWLAIGCAVHHETGGSDFGEQIWREWSEQHHSHNEALFAKAWNSFGTHAGDPNYAEVSFRYVMKLRKERRERELRESLTIRALEIEIASSFDELKAVAEKIGGIKEIAKLDREVFASSIQLRARQLGTRIAIRVARQMVRWHDYDVAAPDWLRNWVFLTHWGQFYNRSTDQYVDRGAFDTAFSRHVGADTTATLFAMRTIQIPVHHFTMYAPGETSEIKDLNGLSWINTYRDTAPAVPAEYTAADLAAIERVKAHSIHLFGEHQRRDIEIVHSTLAYIVQTGQRVNWITIIQGAEAIGKTFYARLMSAVLGGEPHVYELDSDTLTGSNFTEWAEGHQIIYIDELMVHGHRYDVLNKLKPFITNDTISVHPKNRRQYNAINTASYFAATNHRNAVPLTGGDTRYFLLLSQWQDEESVREFKAANPDYDAKLFGTLQESAGALRRWLLEYELHPDFQPRGRAPRSAGKQQIIEESKSELQIAIEDRLESGDVPGVSRDLIVVHLLREALADESGVLPTRELVRWTLQRLQFTPVRGRRVKIAEENGSRDYYCWSKNPDILTANPATLRDIIAKKLRG